MDSLSELLLNEEELIPLIRERLAAGQNVRYLPFRGLSMLPMLRQKKDSVELAPLPDKLKRYDLPVYQYHNGKYVMHRVIGVEEGCYLCLGDNTYRVEKVKHDQMIAVVSAFKRGEKRISVDNRWYRIYCRIWVGIYPMRKMLKMAEWKLRSVLRRLLK